MEERDVDLLVRLRGQISGNARVVLLARTLCDFTAEMI